MKNANNDRRNGRTNRSIGPIGNLFPSRGLALLIAILAAIAMVGYARADDDTSWRVGLEFAWVNPSGDFSTTIGDATTFSAGYDTGYGIGVRCEYRYAPQYGIEVSALGSASLDLSAGASGSSVAVNAFAPVMVSFNFHLTPDRSVDFFVGPMAGLVRYSDVAYRAAIGDASTTVSVEDDLAWGALAGIEIPVGRHGWRVMGNLRYIGTDIRDSGGSIRIDNEFDPLVVAIGVGYRF